MKNYRPCCFRNHRKSLPSEG